MWRPDDWQNPFSEHNPRIHEAIAEYPVGSRGRRSSCDDLRVNMHEQGAYEAGADAILEALKKGAVFTIQRGVIEGGREASTKYTYEYFNDTKGHLVFIPYEGGKS